MPLRAPRPACKVHGAAVVVVQHAMPVRPLPVAKRDQNQAERKSLRVGGEVGCFRFPAPLRSFLNRRILAQVIPRPAKVRAMQHEPPINDATIPHRVEVNLREVGQLFNTMDHSPFHERDLDHDAQGFACTIGGPSVGGDGFTRS
jgi:hypothetical protein